MTEKNAVAGSRIKVGDATLVVDEVRVPHPNNKKRNLGARKSTETINKKKERKNLYLIKYSDWNSG